MDNYSHWLGEMFPELSRKLDEAAHECPMVVAPVVAYKAAMLLEINRKDRKAMVATVFVKMSGLIWFLCIILAPKINEMPDHGKGLLVHLAPIMDDVTHEIEDCAKACDIYYKTNAISRLVSRRMWAEALDQYSAIFRDLRDDLNKMMSQINTLQEIQSKELRRQKSIATMLDALDRTKEAETQIHEASKSALQPHDVQSPEVAELMQTITNEQNGPHAHDHTEDFAHLNNFTSSSDPRIWELLEIILSGGSENALMGLPDVDVQYVLDAMQQITDSPLSLPTSSNSSVTADPRQAHRRLRRLLLKLSLRCNKLPAMLFISVTECSKGSIGGGGFADIYKGIFNEQRVALKRLRVFMMTEESRRPEMMKAFYHECLLWRNLSHKHILPILGIDNQLFNGSLCMVMPWMEHGNIRTVIDVMRNQGSKSPADLQLQVYHWMAEIVSGLAYLHEEGIAHGDVRGVNILIDDSYHVHLADFGLAVFADGASNNYGSMRGGALRWLSPELIDPEELGLESSRPTYASDIYSFACVCIELYTSQSPFFGMPDGTVLVRVLAGKRPKRPTFHGGVEMTDALWDILNRCWAQSASDRPLASEIVTLIDALDEY